MANPKVSIAVLTFNHEKFISQTLEGFLMQETNFDVEIVISDDASNDRTVAILKEYQNKFPKKFNITFHHTNIGMLPNFIYTLKSCKGDYIAFCEGDDYWIDSLKLQKQVDFLENNPEFSICFHNVMVFDETTKSLKEDYITINNKNIYTKEDLVKGNFMHTPSVVLRNDFTIGNWLNESPIGDWPLYLSQINDRKIKKLEDKMAVYRTHQESAWSSKTTTFKIERTLKTIKLLLKNISFNNLEINELESQKRILEADLKNLKGSYYKQFKHYVKSKLKPTSNN